MRVEIDRKAYAHKPEYVTTDTRNKFGGLCQGLNVYVPRQPLAELIPNTAHEIGHAFSNLVSFLSLFSPREIRSVYLSLTPKEVDYLRSKLHSHLPIWVDETISSILYKAFSAIARENTDLSKITIHPINDGEVVRYENEVIPPIKTSKQTRNFESQAYFIQYLICQVIENTIRQYRLDPKFEFIFKASNWTNHRRGQAIAARAIKRNWKVPSEVDLSAKG